MLAQAGSILDRAYFSADGSACMVVRARVSSGERQVVPPYPGALPARLLLSRENSESPPGHGIEFFFFGAHARVNVRRGCGTHRKARYAA